MKLINEQKETASKLNQKIFIVKVYSNKGCKAKFRKSIALKFIYFLFSKKDKVTASAGS